MVNYYRSIRFKKDFFLQCVDNELRKYDIPLSIYDETLMWNLYSEYGKGFMQTGESKTDGYEYTKSFDLDFAVLECVEEPQMFKQRKVHWMVLRLGGEFSASEYPKIIPYQNQYCWDAERTSYQQMIEIVNKLVREANLWYIRRTEQYYDDMAQEREWEESEQLGCGRFSDEEQQFNDMMNDMDAWGNIE